MVYQYYVIRNTDNLVHSLSVKSTLAFIHPNPQPQSSTNGFDMLPIRCILLPAIRNLSCPGDRNKPVFQTILKKKTREKK